MTIHLWHTSRLRSELAAQALSERDSATYMVVAALLYSYTFYAASWFGGYRHWSILLEAVTVSAIGVFGTMECYRANGGQQGQAFLSRFSALCVPVGVKLAFLNAAIALFMYYGFPRIVTHENFRDPQFIWSLVSFVLNLAVSLMFYARLVHHLSFISKTTSISTANAA
jgi:hypothetical protein